MEAAPRVFTGLGQGCKKWHWAHRFSACEERQGWFLRWHVSSRHLLDIIGDKLRGYIGLTMDLHTQTDEFFKACKTLSPHLTHVGLSSTELATAITDRLLDAPCMHPIRSSWTIQISLRSHVRTRHGGTQETRAPDHVLCREELGRSPRGF